MGKVPSTLESLQGIPTTADAFVVIITTDWNKDVCDLLLQGCLQIFDAAPTKYKIITVPGAVELPFAVSRFWQMASAGRQDVPDAFIVFGCVVKGDTPHFEYVCNMVSQGVSALNTSLRVPTIFGVLTVNNMEQAMERCGGAEGHKGKEAATTALKMINLFR